MQGCSFFSVYVRSMHLFFHWMVYTKFTREVMEWYGYKGVKNACRDHSMKLIFPAAYGKCCILKLLLSPPNFLRNDGVSNRHRADGSDLCRCTSD